MMETVLPTYTETFTVEEAGSGVVVDSGTLHGEGWTFCMVDYDHLNHDDNNSALSNDDDDDILLVDVEGDFCNEDNSNVEESDCREVKYEGDESSHVDVEGDFCNEDNSNVEKSDCREVKYEGDESSHVDGYVNIEEINTISSITEAGCSHAHVGGEIIIENNVEIDNTWIEQNDLEIEMSCDSYVSHDMDESDDTHVDELNDFRTDHLEMNIKSEASLDLEDTVSYENYDQYDTNFSREIYTNETNNLHVMKSDYQDDYFVQFSATNNYVDTGSCISDVEVNNIPLYSNHGDGDIPDVFDVGLLPYLLQRKKEEENIQSVLDHREKTVKQKSRNKRSSTGGCCVGCDVIMKRTAQSKRYKQDRRIKQKIMNQMEMLKRRSDELNITTEILNQYCLECNKQIDKIDHYRSVLMCSVCGYRTHCSKAYPDHMITKHGRLANPENTNREFSTGFMECICGVVHIDGNKMANHLVACEYGGMYCRASNLGKILKRSRDDIDILTAETPQRKIPYSRKQTTTNRRLKNSKRTSQCSKLKSRRRGRIFSNTKEVINRNRGTNCSWVLEKPNDIKEIHNYSMPCWLESFKKNANLKKIYNNFRKCATSKSWTRFINMLNKQPETVDIAQRFSCDLEFKEIKVINAEVPIQDYLQEETGPHEIQNIEQEVTKIENSASMITAPNQKHNKKAHNCRERRRRSAMTKLYFELSLLLPQSELDRKHIIPRGKYNFNQSKKHILAQSKSYINMLEKESENLKEVKDWMLLQQDVLKASLKDMQDRL